MLFPSCFLSPLFLGWSLPAECLFLSRSYSFIWCLISPSSLCWEHLLCPFLSAPTVAQSLLCLPYAFSYEAEWRKWWKRRHSLAGFPLALDCIHRARQIAEFPLECWEAAQAHYGCVSLGYSCSRVYFFSPLSFSFMVCWNSFSCNCIPDWFHSQIGISCLLNFTEWTPWDKSKRDAPRLTANSSWEIFY